MSDCSICLSPLEEKQGHTLECNHLFHTKCIIDWFRHNKTSCPICRNIPIEFAGPQLAQQEDRGIAGFPYHGLDNGNGEYFLHAGNNNLSINRELLERVQNMTEDMKNSHRTLVRKLMLAAALTTFINLSFAFYNAKLK